MRFLLWKWRRYPIVRDGRGRSLRQQAFVLFDNRLRPSQISKQKILPVKLNTLFRYFEDWKKEGIHASYSITRKVMKENPDFSQQLITTISKHLEMPAEEVAKRLQRPWGLKQALRGKLPDYQLQRAQGNVEARLQGGLRFMRLAGIFQNSPRELAELLLQITTLKDNAKLEITRQGKLFTCRKQEKGKVMTIELDGRYKNNHRNSM